MSDLASPPPAPPGHQVITDDLRRLAYGTDASFYRLIPEVVAVVESENDLRGGVEAARQPAPGHLSAPPAPACPARRSPTACWR
jgi:hypothetical protein